MLWQLILMLFNKKVGNKLSRVLWSCVEVMSERNFELTYAQYITHAVVTHNKVKCEHAIFIFITTL